MNQRRAAGWQRLAELYDLAIRVPCEGCGAAAGSRCVNSVTGGWMRAPHGRRISAAESEFDAGGPEIAREGSGDR